MRKCPLLGISRLPDSVPNHQHVIGRVVNHAPDLGMFGSPTPNCVQTPCHRSIWKTPCDPPKNKASLVAPGITARREVKIRLVVEIAGNLRPRASASVVMKT